MKMVGHKAESVYRRYAIVDEAMLRDAAVKLAARRAQSPGQSGVVVIEPASWKDAKTLVGRDGIEPPTPGFSDLALVFANSAEVQASRAMFASGSLRLSAPKCS